MALNCGTPTGSESKKEPGSVLDLLLIQDNFVFSSLFLYPLFSKQHSPPILHPCRMDSVIVMLLWLASVMENDRPQRSGT